MTRGARDASEGSSSSRASAAILGSQMLISATELVVIVALIAFVPETLTNPAIFGGIGALFSLVGIAALVPWGRLPRRWRVVLPLLNILAIGLVRAAEPQLGSGLLLVFPVIWLARAFTVTETIIGVNLAILVIWLDRVFVGGPLVVNDFASIVLLPIALGFIAMTVYLAARRTRAQTVLLRSHSKLVETALIRGRRQQFLLAEVLNTVGFGVVAFNQAKQIVFVNRTYRGWIDALGESGDGSVFDRVYQPDRITPYPEAGRPFVRAMAGQEFDDLVIWVGEPGEQRRAAYSVSSRMIHDPGDQSMAGLIVLKDVTQELEAIRGRDDLVGSVTHELRSPLTSILGYLDLVSETDLPAETRAHVEVASGNAERLLVIVNDLLRAASDAEKDLSMSFIPGDVAQIVREAVAANLVYAKSHDVELDMDVPATAPATIDPVRIRQVLDNLITNAIKYNRALGHVLVRIEVDRMIRVEVQDSGLGIPEADLARIFDRFYRTRSARDSTVTGTGLGLAITREIIQRHGGELSVESVLGLGSTFRITLPSDATETAGERMS